VILNDVKKGKLSRPRKRVGRGPSSGHGKTSGRGAKGALSRSGHHTRPMFAGNTLPLFMRFPKRGMGKRFVRASTIINVGDLARYAAGETVDPERLARDGVLKRAPALLKVLGNGNVEVGLTVKAQAFSQSAREKIEAVGGTVEVIEPRRRTPSQSTSSEGTTE